MYELFSKKRKKKERFLQKGIKHGANNPEI